MPDKHINVYQITIHVVLVALALSVIGLVRQNRQLRSLLPQQAEAPRLAAGAVVDPIQVFSLDGDPLLLDFSHSDKDTLLLVFTTTCPACQQNQEKWRLLSASVGEKYDLIGLSLDDLESTSRYHETHNLPFRTVVVRDPEIFAAETQLTQVPYTLHLSRTGQIRASWLGVLSDESLSTLITADRA